MRALAVLVVCALVWLVILWFDFGVRFIGGQATVEYGHMFRLTLWMGGTAFIICFIIDCVTWRKS